MFESSYTELGKISELKFKRSDKELQKFIFGLVSPRSMEFKGDGIDPARPTIFYTTNMLCRQGTATGSPT